MTVASPTPVTMPFGKHKGRPLAEVPVDYLQWMLSEDVRVGRGFKRQVEQEVIDRRTRAVRLAEAGAATNRPGEVDDALRQAVNQSIYDAAVAKGELVVTPGVPIGSPVTEWFLQWHRDWGGTPRVREVGLQEYMDAVAEGKEP